MKTASKHIATREHGFTLLELIFTVALLATLGNLALPAMSDLIARWSRNGATKAITNHLNLARTTAIKTKRRVVMCTSADSTQCGDKSLYDWSKGWILFVDENANNMLDNSESIIAATGPVAGIVSLASSNKVRRFVFMANGLMASGMSSLVVTPRSGNPLKIVVNRSGRFRLST